MVCGSSTYDLKNRSNYDDVALAIIQSQELNKLIVVVIVDILVQ